MIDMRNGAWSHAAVLCCLSRGRVRFLTTALAHALAHALAPVCSLPFPSVSNTSFFVFFFCFILINIPRRVNAILFSFLNACHILRYGAQRPARLVLFILCYTHVHAHVRGYAVLPAVDIRCHASGHPDLK